MRRLKLAVDEVPSLDAWQSLLQRVSKHYDHVDEDRTLMVHAENIAAEEMLELQTALEMENKKVNNLIGVVGSALVDLNQAIHADEIKDARKQVYGNIERQFRELKIENENSELVDDLTALIGDVFKMVDAAREHAVYDAELAQASTLQQMLLPSSQDVDFKNLNIQGYCRSAGYCGGDIWGANYLDDSKVLILVGDVTGHGIASAMVTSMAKAAFEIAYRKLNLKTPSEILGVMNQSVRLASEGEYLMTCAVAIVDLESSEAVISSAGHPSPFRIRSGKEGVAVESVFCIGDPLGWSMATTYQDVNIGLEHGDLLFWYTDGLIETRGLKDRPIGRRNLIRWLKELPANQERAADYLSDKFLRAVKAENINDDVTFVVGRI